MMPRLRLSQDERAAFWLAIRLNFGCVWVAEFSELVRNRARQAVDFVQNQRVYQNS